MHKTRSVASLLLLLAFCLPNFGADTLRLYHIDVEQAAATLLVSPTGKTLLIDSGKNGHGARIKAVMQQAAVTRIDYFVATHYHEDHYGGIDELARDPSITIGKAYDRGDKDELSAEDRGEAAFVNYQATVGQSAEQLTRGETIPLDPAVTVTCVASGGIVLGEVNPVAGVDENDKSIALFIQFGNFRFFVGGDIELTTEGKIASRDLVLDVDLYQADHHGSHTSSSPPLMDDLKPTVVIISNGNNAIYKHPRRHTLDYFASMNPKPRVFQTNKYLKGGEGGNVADQDIADLESTDKDGTIVTTVDLSAGEFTITYRDARHAFPIKQHGGTGTSGSTIVIDSLMPDPTDGPDRENEAVTLRNRSASPVSLVGWFLKDRDSLAWPLESLGTLNAGATRTIRRNGMSMSLNNDGDEITLFGPGNQPKDTFTYTTSQPGILISTGH